MGSESGTRSPNLPADVLASVSVILTAAVLAQETTTPSSGYGSLLFLGVMLVAFYFLIIRPQRTRARQQQEMQSAVSVGDAIETIGGIRGRIVAIDDDSLLIEIESGKMRIARRAVGKRLDAD